MRRAAKRDLSHHEIGDYLRAAKWSVLDLADHGDGVPDYAVSVPDFAALVECKPPGPASSRKLTPKEQAVRDRWQGPYVIAQSGEEALAELEAKRTAWKALAAMEGRF